MSCAYSAAALSDCKRFNSICVHSRNTSNACLEPQLLLTSLSKPPICANAVYVQSQFHVILTDPLSYLDTCADEEDADEAEAAPKTVKETVWEWDLLNDNKAIWLRSSSDVTDAEYTKFYKALAKVGLLVHTVLPVQCVAMTYRVRVLRDKPVRPSGNHQPDLTCCSARVGQVGEGLAAALLPPAKHAQALTALPTSCMHFSLIVICCNRLAAVQTE